MGGFLGELVEHRFACRENKEEFDKKFTDTKRQSATPRPGLRCAYSWTLSEATLLDERGQFTKAVAGELGIVLKALGENRMRRSRQACSTSRECSCHHHSTINSCSESQRDRIEVVLVSPRNPLNIGAAARAMANFGFRRWPWWRPMSSTGARQSRLSARRELLQNAKSTRGLAEAVADCTLVIGTGTLAHRKPEQPVVPLPALAPFVQQEIARGGRVALVFGPEKRGLTREDLSFCHLLVEIPTAPRQPSMNLGQAVAVCLYELAARLLLPEKASDTAVCFRADPRAAGKIREAETLLEASGD